MRDRCGQNSTKPAEWCLHAYRARLDDVTRFVLLHSPAVGPATWRPVAEELRGAGYGVVVPDLRLVARGPAPHWHRVRDGVLAAIGDADPQSLVLVPHSNAGHFVPMLAAVLSGCVRGYVFVDAALPGPDGETALAGPEVMPFLEQRAVNGLLPPWTSWWSDEDVAPLFAGVADRAEIEGEQPRLPLAYYRERVPVPAGWTATPGAYLWFGLPYDQEAARAAAWGWPTWRIPGAHLHLLVDPTAVAAALDTSIAGDDGDQGREPQTPDDAPLRLASRPASSRSPTSAVRSVAATTGSSAETPAGRLD